LASHWLRIAHFFSIEVFSLSSYIVDQYEKHKSTLDYATLGVKYESKRKFWDCFFDAHNKQYVELKGVDVEAQLEKLKLAVERMLGKMKKIGDYELSEFTAHVGGELVFKADGFIEMTWKKPEKKST